MYQLRYVFFGLLWAQTLTQFYVFLDLKNRGIHGLGQPTKSVKSTKEIKKMDWLGNWVDMSLKTKKIITKIGFRIKSDAKPKNSPTH